jgi:hypothetical protein
MSGTFLVDGIRLWLRRRNREKKLALAREWPQATGEVNHWQVVDADQEVSSAGAMYQIEAGFHFILNGEYFGGYLRSVAMGHHEAETKTKGNPVVKVRYDPANPDNIAVLAEDNKNQLSFSIVSG